MTLEFLLLNKIEIPIDFISIRFLVIFLLLRFSQSQPQETPLFIPNARIFRYLALRRSIDIFKNYLKYSVIWKS